MVEQLQRVPAHGSRSHGARLLAAVKDKNFSGRQAGTGVAPAYRSFGQANAALPYPVLVTPSPAVPSMPKRRDSLGAKQDGSDTNGGTDPYTLEDNDEDDENSDRATAPRKSDGVTFGKRRAAFATGASETKKQAQLPALFCRENKRLQAARWTPAGMVNLGNTCYLNSVIQVLLNMFSFTADLGHPALELMLHHLPAAGILAALRATVKKLRAAAQPRFTYESIEPAVEPAELRVAMSRLGSRWRSYDQQDAHEFLVELLEGLQSEVLTAEAAVTGRRRMPHSETRCPAARNMSGCLMHNWTCSSCGRRTRVKEPFTCLSLPLPTQGIVNLYDLVSEYLKEETIDKNCDGCSPSAPVLHTAQHHFWRLPRVLIVHIKRFMPLHQPPYMQQQGASGREASRTAAADAVGSVTELSGLIDAGARTYDGAGVAEGRLSTPQDAVATGSSRDWTPPAPYLYAKVHTVVKVTAGLDLARFCDDAARVHAHLAEGLSCACENKAGGTAVAGNSEALSEGRMAAAPCGVDGALDAAVARIPGATTGCTLDTAGGGSTCPSPSLQPNTSFQERTVQQQVSAQMESGHLQRLILSGSKATTPGYIKLRPFESECGTSAVSTGAKVDDDDALTPYGGCGNGRKGELISWQRLPDEDKGHSSLGASCGVGPPHSVPLHGEDGSQPDSFGALEGRLEAGPTNSAQVTPRLMRKGVGIVGSQPTPEAPSMGTGLSNRTGNDRFVLMNLPPDSTARGVGGSLVRCPVEDTVACSERKAPRSLNTASFFGAATGPAGVGIACAMQKAQKDLRTCMEGAPASLPNRHVEQPPHKALAPVTEQRLLEMTDDERIALALRMSLEEDICTADEHVKDEGAGTLRSSGPGADATTTGAAAGSGPVSAGQRATGLDVSLPTAAGTARLAQRSGAGSGAAAGCTSGDSAGGGDTDNFFGVQPCSLEEGADNEDCVVELQDESHGGFGTGCGGAEARGSLGDGSVRSDRALSGAISGENDGDQTDCSVDKASPMAVDARLRQRRLHKRHVGKQGPEDLTDVARSPVLLKKPKHPCHVAADSADGNCGGDHRVHGGLPVAYNHYDEDDGTTALSPVTGSQKRKSLIGPADGTSSPPAGGRRPLADAAVEDVEMAPVDEDEEWQWALQKSVKTYEDEEAKRRQWQEMLDLPEPDNVTAGMVEPAAVGARTELGCSTPKRGEGAREVGESASQPPSPLRRRSAADRTTGNCLGDPLCSGENECGRGGTGMDALVAAASLDASGQQFRVADNAADATTARRPSSLQRRNSSSAGGGATCLDDELFKFRFSLDNAAASTGPTAMEGVQYTGAGCHRENPLDLTGGGDDEDPDLAKAIMLSLQEAIPESNTPLEVGQDLHMHDAMDLAGMGNPVSVEERLSRMPKVELVSDSEYEMDDDDEVNGAVVDKRDMEHPEARGAGTAAAPGGLQLPRAVGDSVVHGSGHVQRRQVGKRGDAGAVSVMLSLMARYRLQGVVCHKGLTPFSGHYVADVLVPSPSGATGQVWYEHNDAVVSHVDFERVREDAATQGYLFFFVNAPKSNIPFKAALAVAAATPLPQ